MIRLYETTILLVLYVMTLINATKSYYITSRHISGRAEFDVSIFFI